MPGHYPSPSVDSEAQLGRIVASLLREEGWTVAEEPREKNVAPDFLVSGRGKKFVVELKRAAEGRKDRVIPLLSQAALEAVHYSTAAAPVPRIVRGSAGTGHRVCAWSKAISLPGAFERGDAERPRAFGECRGRRSQSLRAHSGESGKYFSGSRPERRCARERYSSGLAGCQPASVPKQGTGRVYLEKNSVAGL